MHNNEEAPRYICHQCCEEDEYLSVAIKSEGMREKCEYCGNRIESVPLPWVAEKVHDAIEEYFQITASEPDAFQYAMQKDKEIDYWWEREGQPVEEIIKWVLCIDDSPVVDDIQSYLSNKYGPGFDEYYEEDPYGDAYYEESSPDGSHHHRKWKRFCYEVTQRARYFNLAAEEILDGLFGNVNSLRNFRGESVVRVAGPKTECEEIYRARVATTKNELERILKMPSTELAAPPSEYAKHGRMNAIGISVFYGAENAEACISEVRPPVGSTVVVGRFQIVRRLRLLDLDTLSKVFARGSYFDPEYRTRRGHAAFLKRLVYELTEPVLPDEEKLKYLPTQMVAEYLSEKVTPKIDGIIFKSSQDEEKGKNIILFSSACAVEPYILPPGTTVSVDYGWQTHDDYDDRITVRESVPQVIKEEPACTYNDSDIFEPREITLSLDVNKDTEVFEIQGTKYKYNKRYTSRYRYDGKWDNEDF